MTSEAVRAAAQRAAWQRAIAAYARHLEGRHGIHHAQALDLAACVAAQVTGEPQAGGCLPEGVLPAGAETEA